MMLSSAAEDLWHDMIKKMTDKTPTELFEEMFSPELFDLTVRKRTRYAGQYKNILSFQHPLMSE